MDVAAFPDGRAILERADDLARHSDAPPALTVAYLTPAHREIGRAHV